VPETFVNSDRKVYRLKLKERIANDYFDWPEDGTPRPEFRTRIVYQDYTDAELKSYLKWAENDSRLIELTVHEMRNPEYVLVADRERRWLGV
jgi:hypothetical protein